MGVTEQYTVDVLFPSLNCYSATYGTLLASTGRDPVVLGDEWGYRWYAPPAEGWPLWYVWIMRRTYEEPLRYWYDLDVDVRVHDSTDAGWAYVCGQLDLGRPVVVTVNAFHLPFSPQFHRQHRVHRVILVRRRGDEVHIVDSYQGAPFVGPLPAERLRTAMGTLPADEMSDGRPITCDLRPTVAVPAAGMRPAAVVEMLHDNATRFLGLDDRPEGRSTGKSTLREGIAAVRDFADRGGRLDPGMVQQGTTWFGELAAQRVHNAAFLVRAGELLDRPGLATAAALATEIGEEWLNVRNIFLLRGPRSPVPTLARVTQRMEDILAREIRMSTMVAEAVTGARVR